MSLNDLTLYCVSRATKILNNNLINVMMIHCSTGRPRHQSHVLEYGKALARLAIKYGKMSPWEMTLALSSLVEGSMLRKSNGKYHS